MGWFRVGFGLVLASRLRVSVMLSRSCFGAFGEDTVENPHKSPQPKGDPPILTTSVQCVSCQELVALDAAKVQEGKGSGAVPEKFERHDIVEGAPNDF